MKNEKKELFETKQFDSAAYATDILNETNVLLEKQKKALTISAIATASWVIAYLAEYIPSTGILDLLSVIIIFAGLIIGLIGTITSYIIGGGFGNALHIAGKIAVFGWFILPFPADIFTGLLSFMVCIMCFFFAPIVVVGLNYRQLKKDKEEAEKYLKYCK